MNGGYLATSYAFAVEAPSRAFGMRGHGPKFEAYHLWFCNTVLPRLAMRDLGRIDLGGSGR